jgi:hypothetical protein
MSKIPGPDRWWWRFLTGQPLDGHYRTDARFFRRGRKALGKVEPWRWSYLAGVERLAVRLVVLAGPPAVFWQYRTHQGRTVGAAVATAVVGLSVALWRFYGAWVRRKTYRTYVRPLHAVLQPLLGLPATTRPVDYIEVPPTYRTKEDTPALIRLPRQFNPSPASRDLVSHAALQKLGINEDNTDVIFRMVGEPVLELKMAPQPPDRVKWDEHKEFMLHLKPGEIFVGLGARNKPYIRDFNGGDLVHGGFSVRTGGGKSAAMMSWIAQQLRSGSTATVLDPKQSSLPTCLVGVPGYRLVNDPDNVPEMWDAIEAFEREMDRRRHAKLNDPTLEFPLAYLYLDELSEFADMTRETWEYVRENPEQYGYEGTIPKRAPIWRSISRILRLGREFDCRVLVFTQRLDNASTGGIGLRDLFGWRGLAGFRKNQWMMLIQTMPIPKSINKVGRWIYSDGNKEVWVQNVYGTPEQLRDWCRGNQDTQGGHMAADDVSPAPFPASVQWDIKGLQAAADYLEIPVGTFRKRRQRAGGTITGEGLQGKSPVWMRADLDRFANRVKAE